MGIEKQKQQSNVLVPLVFFLLFLRLCFPPTSESTPISPNLSANVSILVLFPPSATEPPLFPGEGLAE